MMWQLFHKLFGCHYVEYRDSCTHFVARVKIAPNGKLRMVTFTGVYDAFLAPNGGFEGTGGTWQPLTWIDAHQGADHKEQAEYAAKLRGSDE